MRGYVPSIVGVMWKFSNTMAWGSLADFEKGSARVKRGFTLVEMLVVIALVSVLAVLLIAGTRSVLQYSKKAKCVGNLRQIGLAVRTYLSENNNLMFSDDGGGKPVYKDGYWLTALRDIFDQAVILPSSGPAQGKSFSLFVCPADPTRGGWEKFGAPAGIPNGDPDMVGIRARSYLPNRFALSRRMSEFSRPSQTIIFADYGWGSIGTRSIWANAASWYNNYPQDWHGGKLNCLFMDQHVEALSIKSLKWGGDNTRLWYPDYPDELSIKQK